MNYQEGYVYHIKDEYFIIANDPSLMQNKKNGNYRPTFYCMRDEKTSLLWLVPLSSRVEKFQEIYDKQMKRIRQLHARGKKIVFPDISRLENLMLKETISDE